MDEIRQRNINLDLIRCVAVFSVISVHFFLNNGFYESIIIGKRMFCMTVMKSLFMICVPLFVILTGYLQNKKIFSLKFYKGIWPTIGIYLIISILTIIFNLFAGIPNSDGNVTLSSQLTGILEFNTIGYAWYVDMYIGLFILIPFLNLAYNGCENQKQKLVLIYLLVFLTVPSSVCQKHVVFPAWWLGIWPITYYYIGAYLSEYSINISQKMKYTLFFSSLVLISIINYLLSFNKVFSIHKLGDWSSIENIILSTLSFILILSFNLENLPQWIKNIIIKISKLSLGIYLASYMVDKVVYFYFNQLIQSVPQKLFWYLVVVPIVFICSMAISYLATNIYNLIRYIFNYNSKKSAKSVESSQNILNVPVNEYAKEL